MTIEELNQQIKALQDEVDKLKSEQKKNGIKPWRADCSENYFYISAIGKVCEDYDNRNLFDNDVFLFGNYYNTKELAEQDKNEIDLRNKVRQLRDVLCEEYKFTPSDTILNYTINYNYRNNTFCLDCYLKSNIIGTIWFDTKEHAQKACDILNRELKNGNIKI